MENKTIDSYIAQFPKETQRILQELRVFIKSFYPEAIEAMSYGIPTFKTKDKKNLVHFAAFATHIGFYPAPSCIAAFQKELSHYKMAKGSVQFPIEKPLPFDIIEKIVKFRIAENESKMK
jgi:uncharacterized protein YdhG (YjbR/CyaY superfamily)